MTEGLAPGISGTGKEEGGWQQSTEEAPQVRPVAVVRRIPLQQHNYHLKRCRRMSPRHPSTHPWIIMPSHMTFSLETVAVANHALWEGI